MPLLQLQEIERKLLLNLELQLILVSRTFKKNKLKKKKSTDAHDYSIF